jgi:DNA mismatch repair protein MutH
MERSEALVRLAEIVGEEFNLHDLAAKFSIVPILNGKQNKGWAGQLIQPRTKGPGHGSISRAFYARKAFLNRVMPLI